MLAAGHKVKSRLTATCSMATSPMFRYSAAPVFKPVATITRILELPGSGIKVFDQAALTQLFDNAVSGLKGDLTCAGNLGHGFGPID